MCVDATGEAALLLTASGEPTCDMNLPGYGASIDLSYRFGDGGALPKPLTHPLIAMLRAVREGGSIKAAAKTLDVSYRHIWGALRAAEAELGFGLLRWVQGEGSVLTPRGLALVDAEDLALSRLAPHIEALRAELARTYDAVLGPAGQALSVSVSHDPALVSLRELAQSQRLHLDLRFLGSLDSLRALAEGRCLVAGFHAPLVLPGPDYAKPLASLLQSESHVMISVAQRAQGLIVRTGNPLGLQDVADLARPGLRFVGRQPGSGTRLLADACCRAAGVDPDALGARGRVEESQLAVAAAVACGLGDVGLGIEAAAAAFGLEFVPLLQERYAFVCLRSSLAQPGVQALQALLAGGEWAERLAATPGYNPDRPGTVLSLAEALPWWGERVVTPRRRAVRPH